MKNFGLTVAFLTAATTLMAHADDRLPLREQDKVSYSIGMEVARNFKKNEVPLDPAMVSRGMLDELSGQRALLSDKEFHKVLAEFQNQLRQRMAANTRMQASENRKKAEDFLLNNKTKEGVMTLAGGLQYKVLQAGQGPLPKESETVVINYRGTLLDGTEFDATEPGKPGKAKMFDLFNGLRAGIRQMSIGSHWQLWIPPQLGYGERGVGSDIGPNELLVYDIELVGVVAPQN